MIKSFYFKNIPIPSFQKHASYYFRDIFDLTVGKMIHDIKIPIHLRPEPTKNSSHGAHGVKIDVTHKHLPALTISCSIHI